MNTPHHWQEFQSQIAMVKEPSEYEEKAYFKKIRKTDKITEAGQEGEWMTWEEFEGKVGPRVARERLRLKTIAIRLNKDLTPDHQLEEPYCFEVCKVTDRFSWKQRTTNTEETNNQQPLNMALQNNFEQNFAAVHNMAVPSIAFNEPAGKQQHQVATIEDRIPLKDETDEQRKERIKTTMAEGSKSHGTCDRTKRVWEGRLEQANRNEYTRDSKIKDDLQELIHRMTLLDDEFVDIEKMFQGTGNIDDTELSIVKDYSEHVTAMVKEGRETMATLEKMISFKSPKPKPEGKRL